MTNILSQIKSQIINLYNQNSVIHIDIAKKNKNFNSDISCKITAVYPNIFTVLSNEECQKSYSFQYVDLITHNICIKELNALN